MVAKIDTAEIGVLDRLVIASGDRWEGDKISWCLGESYIPVKLSFGWVEDDD